MTFVAHPGAGGIALAQAGGMSTDPRPRDDDPSDMTDFEKNATNAEHLDEVLGSGEVGREGPPPTQPRERQERGNTGPEKQPGFGQGA